MIVCVKCGVQKSRSEFYKSAQLSGITSKCKSCILLRRKDPEMYRRRLARLNYPAPTRPKPPYCELCGKASKNRSLALDHCHVSNKFRGWLCADCNTGIGKLGDNVEGLEKAIRYLKGQIELCK